MFFIIFIIHLSQEFSGNLLELVKQKGVYLYEYMDSFKKFSDDKLPDICKFFSFLRDECISEKAFFKLINDSVYGKTMGDLSCLY